MKTALIIIIVVVAVVILIFMAFWLIKTRAMDSQYGDDGIESVEFFFLDAGNQEQLIIASNVEKEWLDEVKAKYNWDNFGEYDNRLWEYMERLNDEPVKQYVEQHPEKKIGDLWNDLNRPQKVFLSFLAFNGDTDNGGVYQFIFNRPESMFAVHEMWLELGMEQLATDYGAVLNELMNKSGKVTEWRTGFNDGSKSWEKRFESFANGYKELKSTDKIEEYYYETEFKKELYKAVCDYIEKNMDKFVKE